jgi:hypothetical protein
MKRGKEKLDRWNPWAMESFSMEHRVTMSFMDLEDEEDAIKLNLSFKHVNL